MSLMQFRPSDAAGSRRLPWVAPAVIAASTPAPHAERLWWPAVRRASRSKGPHANMVAAANAIGDISRWLTVRAFAMINHGTIPRIAARLSFGLSVAFLALLAVLHVLEPEFNSGHLISEYQLGKYGCLM